MPLLIVVAAHQFFHTEVCLDHSLILLDDLSPPEVQQHALSLKIHRQLSGTHYQMDVAFKEKISILGKPIC